MAPLVWSKQALELLLVLYSNQNLMYNPKHKYYHNRSARFECEQEIAKELRKIRPGTTYKEVKTKINNMRTAFKAELAKASRKTEPGEEYIPTLWYFNKMMFLTEHMKIKPNLKLVQLTSHLNGDPLNENSDENNQHSIKSETMKAPDYLDPESGSDYSPESPEPVKVCTTYYQPPSEEHDISTRNSMDTSEQCDDVMQSINRSLHTIAQRSSLSQAPAILTGTQAFGNFITASLNEIKSPVIRDECETEMLVILLKAKKKDRFDSNGVE